MASCTETTKLIGNGWRVARRDTAMPLGAAWPARLLRVSLLHSDQDVAMLSQRLVLTARDTNEAKLMTDERRMQHTKALGNELIVGSRNDDLVKTADQR